MMPNARRAAAEILRKMEKDSLSVRGTMEDYFQRHPDLPEAERAFARDLINGALRRLNALDWALDLFAKPSLVKLDPDVRAVLRLGAYQILYLRERVPGYAAVHETVDLLKGKGHSGRLSFANAVLRRLEREREKLPWPSEEKDPAAALALKHSHPEWMVRRWLARLGRIETAALLEADNATAPLCLRANTLRITRVGLSQTLAQESVKATPSAWSPDGVRVEGMSSLADSKAFREGLFLVQDEASQLASAVLAPEPGQTVLDVCAAPGGKTTHIAQLMKNKGRVIALDISPEKLKLVEENSSRLGIRIIEVQAMAARWAGKHFANLADRVLVDAPCSSLGVIRRHPEIRWNKTIEHVTKTLPPLQREALESAAKCLKAGGVLVYSTCTTEPEETEDNISAFLAGHPEFSREWPQALKDSLPKDAITPAGDLMLLPSRHGTDGFFIARLKKETKPS